MTMSQGELGMTYDNLSIGMPLYTVGQQVKWFEPKTITFKIVIPHPSAMHIIMPFCQCSGTLMKDSCLDDLQEEHSAV